MEYYSAFKKNEIMPLAATWVDLEIIILSGVSQTEKDKYLSYDTAYKKMLSGKKNDTNELIYKTETDSQIENTLMVIKGERWQRRINWEFGIDIYSVLYIK